MKSFFWGPLALGLFLAAASVQSTALAQDEEIVEHRDGLDVTHLELFAEVGFGSSKGDPSTFVISPMLAGQYWIPESMFGVGLKWGFASGHPDGADSHFSLANPQVSGHLNVEGTFGMLDLGLAVAIPLVDSDEPLAYASANAIRGLWDFWLWTPDAFTLALPVRLEIDIPGAFVASDLGLALMIATGDNDTEFGTQIGAEAGLGLGLFDLGVRAQAVWIPTADGDNAQLSFGPLARANFDTVFLEGRFWFNVDSPAGFSFADDGAFWGAFIGGGVNL